MAERLAAASGIEAVAVALVADAGELAGATDRLRSAAPSARVAAFTTVAAGEDAVRLAAEQDAAVLLLAAPGGGRIDPELATVLRAAACDVALVSGAEPPAPDGRILVPFSGSAHDWAAAELGATLGGGAVTLLGVSGSAGRRDASRLLANASLALQRGAGVTADTLLAGPGAGGVLEAAADAAAVVTGLSERWQREGIGAARARLLGRGAVPGAARAPRRPAGRARAAAGADAVQLVRRRLISAPTPGRAGSPTAGCAGRCAAARTPGSC